MHVRIFSLSKSAMAGILCEAIMLTASEVHSGAFLERHIDVRSAVFAPTYRQAGGINMLLQCGRL